MNPCFFFKSIPFCPVKDIDYKKLKRMLILIMTSSKKIHVVEGKLINLRVIKYIGLFQKRSLFLSENFKKFVSGFLLYMHLLYRK